MKAIASEQKPESSVKDCPRKCKQTSNLHGISQQQQGCDILQNVVELYNHFIFVATISTCHGFDMLITDPSFILIISKRSYVPT